MSRYAIKCKLKMAGSFPVSLKVAIFTLEIAFAWNKKPSDDFHLNCFRGGEFSFCGLSRFTGSDGLAQEFIL